MSNLIRLKTVKLIKRLLNPFAEEGVIGAPELNEIIANLKHLSEKGTLVPSIKPKLIDQKEAAEMLGIGFSNFKKLEKENEFPFQRKMLGSSVRYRNTDVISYILGNEN